MRSYFQNQKDVAYLFLGSKEGMMKTLFSDKREAFYRFATILPLPPIPAIAWGNISLLSFGPGESCVPRNR